MSNSVDSIQEVEESATTFEEDLEAFNRLSEEMVKDHKGKFLLVKNGKNQGFFRILWTLTKKLWRSLEQKMSL